MREAGQAALISAHRGGSEDVEPATWEAYGQAAETGAEYVELDIRRLKDGNLVVYHDERVDHTGPELATCSYQQLCDEVGYEVPLVPQVMELLAGKVIGHLDLKEIGYEDDVVGLATEVFGDGNFVITSLEDVSIADITRRYPDVQTALSLGRDLDGAGLREKMAVRRSELSPLGRVRACGTRRVAVHHQLASLSVLGICARHGMDAMVWTANSEKQITKLLDDSRVDVLITDRPRLAVSLRGRAPG